MAARYARRKAACKAESGVAGRRISLPARSWCGLVFTVKTLLPVLLAVLALIPVGCRKRPATPPPPPPAPAPAPGTAPEGTAGNPGNAAEMAASNAAVLTMMLQEFVAANKRIPTSVKELEAIKTYGPVQPPPPGFRYVIDPNRKQVLAVKQ